jgi:hypothetical protein
MHVTGEELRDVNSQFFCDRVSKHFLRRSESKYFRLGEGIQFIYNDLFCHCILKATKDNLCSNGHSCVPIKLSSQDYVVARFGPWAVVCRHRLHVSSM